MVGVLVASGAIGFLLGLVCHPSMHDALERAQALGGVVHYDSGQPFYGVLTRTWTVVHQALAFFLQRGISERTLALALSGIAGMLSLQALGLLVLALSGVTWIAILGPVFIYLVRAVTGGVTYPLYLMGFPSTDGLLGFSYVMLGFGLIGVGQARAGALLLGAAPALYSTLGLLTWGVVTLAMLPSLSTLRPAWRYFLLGAGTATLVLVAHHRQDTIGGLGAVWSTLAEPSALLSHALMRWDVHRQPFSLLSGSIAAIGFSVALSLLWISRFAHDLPGAARTLLLMVIIAAVAGSTLSVSYWLMPAAVPATIALLMPSRLMDVGVFVFPALVLGLLGRYHRDSTLQVTLAAAIAIPLAVSVSVNEEATLSRFANITLGLAALALVGLAERRRRGLAPWTLPAGAAAWPTRGPILVVSMLLLVDVVNGVRTFDARVRRELRDWTTDPLLATASRRTGLLLVAADLDSIQMRTRRPLLLESITLDRVIYAPHTLEDISDILQRVYGTDFMNLPAGGPGPEWSKELWEARTAGEWRDIAKEFGVTDVITYPGWRLQLPLVATSSDYLLYELPPG